MPCACGAHCRFILLHSHSYIAPSSNCTYVDVGGRLVASFPCVCMRVWPSLGDAVWGRDSCDTTSLARLAGRLHDCSPVPGPRLGYTVTYNARRNPRSLQYYSRLDVPSTVTPQRLREGDDLQERCVLGSRGVRPHPTNPP